MQGDTLNVWHDLCLRGLAGTNKGLSHEENETFHISKRLQLSEALKCMSRFTRI